MDTSGISSGWTLPTFSNYNTFMAEKKVMGPASYFPSIEKKYGKPIEHWMKELKKVSKLAHMEQVSHLKEKFEMGHGHANALVAYLGIRTDFRWLTQFT